MCTIQLDCSCSPYGADSQGKKQTILLLYFRTGATEYRITKLLVMSTSCEVTFAATRAFKCMEEVSCGDINET